MNWPRLCSRVPNSSWCNVIQPLPTQSDTVGWYHCPICPDRRDGAAPRQCALPLRSLKLASSWEWEELSSEYDGFCIFAFHVFFLMILLSFEAGLKLFLDGSRSGSKQNVPTAPAPAEMYRVWWLQLRSSCASLLFVQVYVFSQKLGRFSKKKIELCRLQRPNVMTFLVENWCWKLENHQK